MALQHPQEGSIRNCVVSDGRQNEYFCLRYKKVQQKVELLPT